MYWNHRMMERIEGAGTGYEETVLYIVEVFYDSDSHQIIGWTEKEDIWGEGIDALRQTLHWMLDATEKAVLNEVELLAEMASRPPEPEEPYERVSIEELLDSLGLEREDVEDYDTPNSSS